MERTSWERALARAVTDRPFRARLLNDPAGTLADYGLAPQDRPLVDALRKTPTLSQLAAGFLHLAATAWAQPASPQARYVEDPFSTPYPAFADQIEDRWIAGGLVSLDQALSPAPSGHGITHGITHGIAIRVIKGGAGTSEGAAPNTHEEMKLYRKPEQRPQRTVSRPREKDDDDAVNF
jgi:hypothetical protein